MGAPGGNSGRHARARPANPNLIIPQPARFVNRQFQQKKSEFSFAFFNHLFGTFAASPDTVGTFITPLTGAKDFFRMFDRNITFIKPFFNRHAVSFFRIFGFHNVGLCIDLDNPVFHGYITSPSSSRTKERVALMVLKFSPCLRQSARTYLLSSTRMFRSRASPMSIRNCALLSP